MAKKVAFTETEQSEINRIQQAFGISRKAAIRKMRSANKKSQKAAMTPDFKSAAANDKSEIVAAPKNAKKAKRAVAPKKLTSTEADEARAAGMKLLARPTKEQFIAVNGPNGTKMTWDQRAAAGVPAKKFQEALQMATHLATKTSQKTSPVPSPAPKAADTTETTKGAAEGK